MKRIVLILILFFALAPKHKAQEFFNANNLCFAKMDSIQLYSSWSRPRALDFNNDGKMDFAIIDKNADSLYIYFNNGNANFKAIPSLKISTGTNAKDLCVADFNGDSYIDVATINSTGDLVVFKNVSGTGIIVGGTFMNTTFMSLVSYQIESSDMNNDSEIDIIGTGKDASVDILSVFTFENFGSFNFASISSFPVFTGHTLINVNTPDVAIDIADFNTDGYNDFVIGTNDFTDTIEVYEHNGTAAITFKPPVILKNPMGTFVEALDAKDRDGDAQADITITSPGGFAINKNIGSFSFVNFYSNTNASGKRFKIKDIDADSRPDLVMAYSGGSFIVYKGTTLKGYPFQSGVSFFVYDVYRFLLEDFDGNLIPDFVFVGEGDAPYLMNLRNFSFHVTATITSSNTAICGTTPVSLFVNNSHSYPGNYIWYPSSVNAQNMTATTSGSYSSVFSYTLPPGYGQCNLMSDTIAVQSLSIPSVAIVQSPNGTVCAGTKVDLLTSITAGLTYSWSTGSTSSSITVNPGTTTIYTVNLFNGCSGSETVVVNVKPNPTVNISASSTNICIGDSVLLAGSGALTYQWVPAISTLPNIYVKPSVSTGYSLIGSNSFGCTDTAFVNITVNTVPVLVITPSKPAVCFGDTVKLTVTGATTYSWNNGSTLAVIQVTPNIFVNSYTVTGYNGCKTTSSITIPVKIPPIISTAVSKSSVCDGDSVTMQAFGAATYTWVPTFLTGGLIYDYPSANTSYTVVGQGTNGCYNYAIIPITVNTGITPTITASDELCIGKEITISVSGAVSYTWDSGSNDASFNVTPIDNQTLTYTVCSIDINGCKSSAEGYFVVSDKCHLVIFNGVTPNGDGKNDIFFLENIEQYPGNSVTIFNRWGQLLSEIHNYNNTNNFWSGNDSGNEKNIPSGTYYYVIDLNNGSELLKGWIELTKKALN